MQALAYYISLPLIYLVSVLPFPLLYAFSSFLRIFIFDLIGYRRKVVDENLRNSFPDKSSEELRIIRRKFEEWFCDLIVETLKTLTVSPKTMMKRMEFEDNSVLRKLQDEGRSAILVMGHFGNWEYGGARYSAEKDLPQLYVIYHPLQNKYFDRLIHHARTRHGTKLYRMRETSKSMIRDKDLVTATTFIADQTPSPERAYWTTFLHQDTPVFFGTEALSKKLNQPIVYISITRPKRGRYLMRAEMLVSDPASSNYGVITEKHTQRLERDIKEHPHIWLWTHRRWKHKRPLGHQNE